MNKEIPECIASSLVVVVLFSPKRPNFMHLLQDPPFPLNIFYWTVPVLMQVEHFFMKYAHSGTCFLQYVNLKKSCIIFGVILCL